MEAAAPAEKELVEMKRRASGESLASSENKFRELNGKLKEEKKHREQAGSSITELEQGHEQDLKKAELEAVAESRPDQQVKAGQRKLLLERAQESRASQSARPPSGPCRTWMVCQQARLFYLESAIQKIVVSYGN